MLPRKLTPRVKDGRVGPKDRAAVTAPDGYTLGASLQIIRHAPGPGRVHMIDEADVRRFLDLIPDWPEIGAGVHAIVLDRDRGDFDGCYRHDGVIVLSSWPAETVRYLSVGYCDAHRDVFDRIGIPRETASEPDGYDPDDLGPDPFVRCWFEPRTARDYLLMHVLLHELGHHLDRRTLRKGAREGRGEDFAEAWALERERALWPRYRAAFGGRGR
jgi:hypothetical protein